MRTARTSPSLACMLDPPKGKRVYGAVPRNRRANITLLAALSLQGMGEAFILEGSADAAVFELSIKQILAPSFPAGHIVILDNVRTHLGKNVRHTIEARGRQLLFLPSSPDFSPIEEAFSTLKASLRRVGARTQEAWQEAMRASTSYDDGSRCARVVSSLWLLRLPTFVFPGGRSLSLFQSFPERKPASCGEKLVAESLLYRFHLEIR